MGTPFVILATGQSNIELQPAYSWAPNARARQWNNVIDNDESVGTAYGPLSNSTLGIAAKYAHNVAAADPDKDVYLVRYARGGRDILHWVGGGFFNPGSGPAGSGIYNMNAAPETATVMTMSNIDIHGVRRPYLTANALVGERIWLTGSNGVTYVYQITGAHLWSLDQATFPISRISGSGTLAGPVQISFQPRFTFAMDNSLPAALTAAGKSSIDMLLWWQCESDAQYNSRYELEFEALISYCTGRPWWGSNTQIVMCGMNSTANNGMATSDTMNSRLAAIAAGASNRHFANLAAGVPANAWSSFSTPSDPYHMTPEGYYVAADYVFNSVYAPAIGGSGSESGAITSISVGALSVVMDVRTNGNHGLLSDGTPYGLWLDGSPHPYRDGAGNKYLVMPHSENYRFLVGNWSNGATWTLQGTTLEGARNTAESAYNNRNWVFGLWSEGNTIYSLLHHEWYVNNRTIDGIAGFNALNTNPATFNRQWVNCISWAQSTDGGRNFATAAPANSSRLVLVPEPWNVQSRQHLYGFFHPSNIVKEGAYYYAAVEQRSLNASGTAANSGVSLIRTTNPAAPTGWEFWNGSSWVGVNHSTYQGNASTQVPHRFFAQNDHNYYDSAAYNSHMGQCLRYHAPSAQWLMFGYTGTNGAKLGYSKSPTLVNPQFTSIIGVSSPSPGDYDGSAGRYVSVFNENATDNNYQEIGNTCTVLVTNGAQVDAPTTQHSYSQIKRGTMTIVVDGSANATYSINANTTTTSEGLTVTYTVTTTNVGSATLYWSNAGTTSAADFTDNANTGSVAITANSGSFTRTLANDAVTEGAETIIIQLRTGSTAGPVVATAPTVTVAGDVVEASGVMRFRSANNLATILATASNVRTRNASNSGWMLATRPKFKMRDATNTFWMSVIPAAAGATYAINVSATNVNEGVMLTFTVTTTNVGSATLFWTNAGTTVAADFTDGANSGSVAVTSNSGSFTRTLLNDALTEGGETVVIQLRLDSTAGAIVATSPTVTVNDSSTTAPTFAITPNVSSVNEGGVVTYTVSTSNYGSGTLYWTNAGTSSGADFTDGANSGSVAITSNSGSFSRTLVNDLLTEGTESILMQLRTGSTAGSVVATASSVTISDTSTAPYAPPNPYTLTLVRNDLDFIYASDLAHQAGKTRLNLEFTVSFDDLFTAGADHLAIVINAELTDPHTNHCGPVIRNGKNLWSYGRGFFIRAGNNQVFAEHWNGTASPGVELATLEGGTGFNPSSNPVVRVQILGFVRSSGFDMMIIIIRDNVTGTVLFQGSKPWGWDDAVTYKAAIAGIAVPGFVSPNDTGCVEKTGTGNAPNASCTISNITLGMI